MQKIHLIGDSISLHYGKYLQQYLDGFAEYSRKGDEIGLRLPVRDNNGGDSSMVLSYLDECAEAGLKWDWLIINCGLHDIKTNLETGARQVEPGDYQSNLEHILNCAGKVSSGQIWIRTTPVVDSIHNIPGVRYRRFAEDVRQYNAIADKVMLENKTPRIDLYRFTVNLGTNIYCDHVHFSETVRMAQAAFVAGALSAVLQLQPEFSSSPNVNCRK
ncbi:MAG: hypothetical protein A2017_01675 [Lentisphaerae bacterium GWF2_44_16]|nr:MAG: hypothetical protein A2017_01675 [Lentisphaerae bacterium GWF2_44_16]